MGSGLHALRLCVENGVGSMNQGKVKGHAEKINTLIDPHLLEGNHQAGRAWLPRSVSLERPWSGGPDAKAQRPAHSVILAGMACNLCHCGLLYGC